MPILARITPGGTDPDPDDPDPGGPPPVPVPHPDGRSLDFRAFDGRDVIEWSGFGGAWVIQSGIQGLDVPPREVITEKVPGLPGGRLREIRDDVRSVVLPFFVQALDDRLATHREQLAAIRRHLQYRDRDYMTAEGTFDLVAVGEGTERSLRCTYVDGMEGMAGVAAGSGWAWSTFDCKLLAVDPYWHGAEWSTPTVGTGSGLPFLSDTQDWPRPISGSVALGADMAVTVGGDIPSPPTIELRGPFDSVHITSPSGLDVTVADVGSGSTVRIETGRRRRVLLDGAPAWGLIADAPRWQPLPPGLATISVVATGATSSTSVRVYGTSLWETAW